MVTRVKTVAFQAVEMLGIGVYVQSSGGPPGFTSGGADAWHEASRPNGHRSPRRAPGKNRPLSPGSVATLMLAVVIGIGIWLAWQDPVSATMAGAAEEHARAATRPARAEAQAERRTVGAIRAIEIARRARRAPRGKATTGGRKPASGASRTEAEAVRRRFEKAKRTPFKMTWERLMGGRGHDQLYASVALPDGGLVAVGHTDVAGVQELDALDAWIVRVDRNGRRLWDRTYGGSKRDAARSIVRLPDGGFVVAGQTKSKGAGGHDAWLLRLDENGRLLWDRTYGGPKYDIANSIVRLPDGGLVVAGLTDSKGAGFRDVWIFRLDAKGKVVWDRTYGGPKRDEAHSIVLAPAGGFIVAADTSSKGTGKGYAWILRLDGNGNILWDRTFGRPDGGTAESIVALSNGGFMVAGSRKNKQSVDAWIYELEPNGGRKPARALGGFGDDYPRSIVQLPDGGFLVVGDTFKKSSIASEAWIWRFNRSGRRLWKRVLGGWRSYNPQSVVSLSDGGYALVGGIMSSGPDWIDAWMFRLDPQDLERNGGRE